MYKIQGVVTGHYATKLKIRAHDAVTGALLGETLLDTGEAASTPYEIDVPEKADCYVVLLPDIGERWRTGRLHALGDHVYPTAFAVTPYYFTCTGAGINGVSEPVFTSTPLVSIEDGHCVWERVERIPFPLVKFPVTPA